MATPERQVSLQLYAGGTIVTCTRTWVAYTFHSYPNCLDYPELEVLTPRALPTYNAHLLNQLLPSYAYLGV